MLVDPDILEVIHRVALIAEWTEIAMVYIIAVMTIYTAAFYFLTWGQRFVMTTVTVHPFVCPSDFKIGSVMIKLPDQPIIGVMAGCTIHS